jgi:hypothetical protein
VTSGTVFANRKLSFKKIMMAIWEEITAAKGMAALHLSRKLNVQYKTAYVLLQKLREAVGLRRDAIKLRGKVQIDGKYVGGVLRKANKKEERRYQWLLPLPFSGIRAKFVRRHLSPGS